MLVRSPATAIPVLVGFEPGVTLNVSNVVPPTPTGFGLADPVPDGLVGVRTLTVSEILPLPLLLCASLIEKGIDLLPPEVLAATVALNEKTLSPAVASPFDPSSKND